MLTTAFDGQEALEWRAHGVQAVLLKAIAPRVLMQCVGFVCRQSQRELHLAGAPDTQSGAGQAEEHWIAIGSKTARLTC